MSKKFNVWMNSIDNDLLEEAAGTTSFAAKKSVIRRIIPLAAAACLVLAVAGIASTGGLFSKKNSTPPAEFAEHGYTLPVPAEATNVAYQAISGKEYTVPVAEASFTVEQQNYTLRAYNTEQPQNISEKEDSEPLVWYAAGLEVKLCSTNDSSWVSWYDEEAKMQWCLMTENAKLALLTTANDIVNELGYQMAVAPAGAEGITYDAFRLDEMTVAKTTYTLNGIQYSYSTAAASGFELVDISGTENYSTTLTTQVGWCPAELSYTEGGSGKIIWFDVVPGLLYSLTMETGASEDALLTAALEVFEPAQDNADWK